VITNNHVVRPARGREIGVRTANGVRYSGRVVAVDPMNDLALVKVDTRDRLPSLRLGSPQAIQMGQPVCAIGSPFGQAGVLTRGTLTTVRRNGDLQSALVLQPGNSGGPLLNQQGEMIGINKAIWQSRDGVNSGISFATNIDAAKSFIEQNGGTVEVARSVGFNSTSVMVPGKRREPSQPPANSGSYTVPSINQGSYPVPAQPLSPGLNPPLQVVSGPRLGVMLDKDTLIIQQVEAISAAGVAGLQAGDRLVAIDGTQLKNYSQLQNYLSNRPSSAVLTINRNKQMQTVQINF
jgi:serine protease Do